jgi:hypothetical protein
MTLDPGSHQGLLFISTAITTLALSRNSDYTPVISP